MEVDAVPQRVWFRVPHRPRQNPLNELMRQLYQHTSSSSSSENDDPTPAISWMDIQVEAIDDDEYQLLCEGTLPAVWAAYTFSGAGVVLLVHHDISGTDIIGCVCPRQVESELISVENRLNMRETACIIAQVSLDRFIHRTVRIPDQIRYVHQASIPQGSFSTVVDERLVQSMLSRMNVIGECVAQYRKSRGAAPWETIAYNLIRANDANDPCVGSPEADRFQRRIESMLLAYRACLADQSIGNPDILRTSTKRTDACKDAESLFEMARAFAADTRVRIDRSVAGRQGDARTILEQFSAKSWQLVRHDARRNLIPWALGSSAAAAESEGGIEQEARHSLCYDYSRSETRGEIASSSLIPFCEQTYPTTADLVDRRLPTLLCRAKTEQEALLMLEDMYSAVWGRLYESDNSTALALDAPTRPSLHHPVRMYTYLVILPTDRDEQTEIRTTLLPRLLTEAMRQLFAREHVVRVDNNVVLETRRLFLVAPDWVLTTAPAQCQVAFLDSSTATDRPLMILPEFIVSNMSAARAIRASLGAQLLNLQAKETFTKVMSEAESKHYVPHTCKAPASAIHPSGREIAARALSTASNVRSTVASPDQVCLEDEALKQFCVARANLLRTYDYSKNVALPLPTDFYRVPRSHISHSMTACKLLDSAVWSAVESTWPLCETPLERSWRRCVTAYLSGERCTWHDANPSFRERGSSRCQTCRAFGTNEHALLTYLDLPAWAHADTIRYAAHIKRIISKRIPSTEPAATTETETDESPASRRREIVENAFYEYARSIGIGNLWKGILNVLRRSSGAGAPPLPRFASTDDEERRRRSSRDSREHQVSIRVDMGNNFIIDGLAAYRLYTKAAPSVLYSDVSRLRDFVDAVRGNLGDYRPELACDKDVLVYGKKGGSLRFGRNGQFYEFSNRSGGDLYEFVCTTLSLDFIEAAKWVRDYITAQSLHDDVVSAIKRLPRDLIEKEVQDASAKKFEETRLQRTLGATGNQRSQQQQPPAKKRAVSGSASFVKKTDAPQFPSMDLMPTTSSSISSASSSLLDDGVSNASSCSDSVSMSGSVEGVLSSVSTTGIASIESAVQGMSQTIIWPDVAMPLPSVPVSLALPTTVPKFRAPKIDWSAVSIDERKRALASSIANSTTVDYAREIWSESIPITPDSLAYKYLSKARGLVNVVDRFTPEVARYHPPKNWNSKESAGCFAAVVFPMYHPYQDRHDDIQNLIGVHAVLIDERGKKARTTNPKRTYGTRDAYVMVHMPSPLAESTSTDPPVVMLGEGPETTLSACEAYPNSYGFCSAGIACPFPFENLRALNACGGRVCVLGDNDTNTQLIETTNRNFDSLCRLHGTDKVTLNICKDVKDFNDLFNSSVAGLSHSQAVESVRNLIQVPTT